MATLFPILENDVTSEAKIEPSKMIKPRDVPEHCIISFFREVNDKLTEENEARVAVANRWEDGPHPIMELQYKGRRLAYFHPGVGAPIASSLLEEAIAFGCRKFIVIGGAGVLEKGFAVGKLMLVEAALRDEGVSYHYLPPAREVAADPGVLRVIESVMDDQGLPYQRVKTWTTDAPYRETQSMIDARLREGCQAVEMESAAFLAVAQFRNVKLGQILYAGDDLSGEEWDKRGWQSRKEIRENLFWIAAEVCCRL